MEELSPEEWYWAKPRATSPARLERPVVSPRGRATGPASSPETGPKGGGKEPGLMGSPSAAAKAPDAAAPDRAPVNKGSVKENRTPKGPAQGKPSGRDLTEGSGMDTEMVWTAAGAAVDGE